MSDKVLDLRFCKLSGQDLSGKTLSGEPVGVSVSALEVLGGAGLGKLPTATA